MFIRIVGDEESLQFRDVSPDTANELVERDHIAFCMKCKVFHMCDGITWPKLAESIQTIVN